MQEYNIDQPGAAVADLWETRIIGIEGMTCDNCVKTLTKAIKQVNGVKDVQVDRENARATVTFEVTRHAIEAPIVSWSAPPRRLVRISAQAYNRMADYEKLAKSAVGTVR